MLIATVNEDANSSVYTITPGAAAAAQIQHYRYNETLPHDGGTDAISVYHGLVLLSDSAPGTTGNAAPQPTYPAAYSVTFSRSLTSPLSRRCSTTRPPRPSPTWAPITARWYRWL
jgi:hypothetical protein